jgi:peptide chain release factor subunit 1
MELTYYFNRVAQITREYFIDIYSIKGLIISGPGPTKEEFVNDNYLEYRLQDMIISTIDASYAGSEGIREAFDRSSDSLSKFRLVEEKQIVEKLFKQINSNSGLGVYGLNEIIIYLKNNVVDTIIVTDKIGLYRIEAKCNRCNDTQEKIIEQAKVIRTKTELANSPCSSCKSLDIEVSEQDIVDYLSILGAKLGTKIEVISGVSEYGVMVSNLGNIGAILRYNPNYTN